MGSPLLYIVISGACISLASSSIVLIQLAAIKYKDFANLLVFLLVSVDLITSILVFFLIFPLNDPMCLITSLLAGLIREIHKLLIIYISYFMYSTIVKQSTISKAFIITLSVFGCIDVIYNILLTIVIYKPIKQYDICHVTKDNEMIVILIIIFEVFPDFVIFVCLIWLYNSIRNTLKTEAACNDLKCASNRIFAKRLIGYGLVFILYFVPFYVLFGLGNSRVNTNNSGLKYLWFCFVAWYPFFDSIMYGCTKSFKRNLFNICFKNPNFDMEEEVMFILRNENILRPRFYLDLIGESEKIGF